MGDENGVSHVTKFSAKLILNKVKIVKALDHIDEIYSIQKKCYDDYPKQYRPTHSYEKTKGACKVWDLNHIVYMAFSEETGQLLMDGNI